MGTVAFTRDNMSKDATSFPKLKLVMNETARITCLENPFTTYVHTLRKPKIVNGRPEFVDVKDKEGNVIGQDFDKVYVGQQICLGDEGVLADRGKDPTNCMICAAAENLDTVDTAKRRFAMHVIQYKTVPGSSQIATPFSVEAKVWGFTQKVFDKLVAIAEEFGDPASQHPLAGVDLILGPLTAKPENFQKFDIGAAKISEWQVDQARQALVVETYRNQRTDLEAICGRRSEKKWIQQDLDEIAAALSLANAAHSGQGVAQLGAPQAAQAQAQAPQQDIQALLGQLLASQNGAVPAPPAQAAPAATPPEAVSPSAASAPQPGPEAVASQPGAVPAAGTADLSALLGGLDVPPAQTTRPVPDTPAQPAATPPASPVPDMAALLGAPQTPGDFAPVQTAAAETEKIQEAAPAAATPPAPQAKTTLSMDDLLGITGA